MATKIPPPEGSANKGPPRTGREALAFLVARNEARRAGKPLPTVREANAHLRADPDKVAPAPKSTPAQRKKARRAKIRAAKIKKQTEQSRRQARDARKDARATARMLEWVETVEVIWSPHGTEPIGIDVLEGQPLPVVPAEVQRSIGTIVADPSGACVRDWFRNCPLKAFCGLVRKTALVPDGSGGWVYSWGDLRARQAVGTAALLYAMKVATERGDHWAYMADGMPREFIGWMVRDRHVRRCTLLGHNHSGQCVSRNKLTGTYGYGGNWNSQSHDRGNRPGRGCGIIRAFRDVGAVAVPHNRCLPPKYVTENQPNAYWLLADMMRSYRVAELMDLAERERCWEWDEAEEPAGIYDKGRGPPH